MEVTKCKWKYGAKAPVMFMIDDLCNKYMTDKRDGNYLSSDWGGKGLKKNSFWDFLSKNILLQFPYVKVTMFLVVGKRAPVTKTGKESYSEPMDQKGFIELIELLLQNSNIELAYHGLTHGKVSNQNHFIQEWNMFNTLEEAIDTINKGKLIYRNITNEDFRGGKYCGYAFNEISDDSIYRTGFKWWCRHWEGSYFLNKFEQHHSLELEEFNGVVDIPSTVDGSLFSLKCWRGLLSRGYIKALYYKIIKKITIEEIINYLIDNQHVISIQEHTSPCREDGKIQYPNVVSDKENLIYLFKYLQNFDLWYATGSEVEKYYRVYKNSEIRYEPNKKRIKVFCSSLEYENEHLTIGVEHKFAKGITLKNEDEVITLCKKGHKFLGEVYPKKNGNEYIIIVVA